MLASYKNSFYFMEQPSFPGYARFDKVLNWESVRAQKRIFLIGPWTQLWELDE